MAEQLRLYLFGTPELRAGGQSIDLGGPRARSLLAYLVVHRDGVTPADQLLDALWPDVPTERARRSLHTHISTLRRGLGTATTTAARIERDGVGYRFDPADLWIDVIEFERLGDQAAHQRDAAAAGSALQLWRGDPLVECATEPWAQLHVAALRQRHAELLVIHADAELAAGRHAKLLPELPAELRLHPFDEPLWERYLLALYRSGRQGEALEGYRQLEVSLREELGVDPGPGLQGLHRRILLHEPSLLGPDAARHEVPRMLTSFVGRQAELEWLDSLLRDHALVTLAGPGGVGKTRTAVEFAHRQRGRWTDGIVLVDLASTRRANRVDDVVAEAFEVPVAPGRTRARLVEHLRSREVLLVLDNGEHLRAEVAELVAALLRAGTASHVLVTSRTALGLTGEVILDLPPLALPVVDEPLETAGTRDAVRLFVDRAQAVRPAFQLGATNVTRVVQLCHRLDGLPLALELAASRLRSMGLSEIVARLEDDPALLRSADPTVDERHRTIGGVLDWSTGLLSRDAAETYACVSVAPGTFDRGLAVAVTGHDEGAVIGELDELVAHSLLTADTDGPVTRYRMLEVVRDHASASLDRSGAREEVERRLIGWALRCIELPTLTPRSQGSPAGLHLSPSDWVERLAGERHNLRAALSVASRDADGALQLATRMARYWWANAGIIERRHPQHILPAVHEGVEWLEQLRELPGVSPQQAGRATVALGLLLAASGQRRRAMEELLAVRGRLERDGRLLAAGWASFYAGTASVDLVPVAETRQLYLDAHTCFARAEDFEGPIVVHACELLLALKVADAGEVDRAVTALARFTERATAPGAVVYRVLRVLAEAVGELYRGDLEAARDHLASVYGALHRVTDPVTVNLLLTTIAWWAAASGRHHDARRLLATCQHAQTVSGLDLHFAAVLYDLTLAALGEQRVDGEVAVAGDIMTQDETAVLVQGLLTVSRGS